MGHWVRHTSAVRSLGQVPSNAGWAEGIRLHRLQTQVPRRQGINEDRAVPVQMKSLQNVDLRVVVAASLVHPLKQLMDRTRVGSGT